MCVLKHHTLLLRHTNYYEHIVGAQQLAIGDTRMIKQNHSFQPFMYINSSNLHNNSKE